MEQQLYYIRRMRDGDIPQVIEIDLDAFPTQWPHPSTNSFHQEMRNKLAHYYVICQQDSTHAELNPESLGTGKGLSSFVKKLLDRNPLFRHNHKAGPKEYLVGVAGIWMMVDEAHVTTIAVRNSHRRRGLGEWLLIAIIDLAIALSAHSVTLEVRTSNTVAQELYEKYGFSRAGIRKRYYSDNQEDAIIMSTDLLMSSSCRSRFQRLKEEHCQRWNLCNTAY